MANPLDEEIARQKKAQLQSDLAAKAIASGSVIAEDTATHERDAQMAADEQKAADLAEIEHAKRYTPEQKFAIALQNDRKDREFRQSIAGREQDTRDRALGQNEHEQLFREHHAAIADDLNERQYALQQSQSYLEAASKKHDLDNKILSNIHAANFLAGSAGIDMSDPEVIAKHAKLASDNYLAGDNPAVQARLAQIHTVQQNQLSAKQVMDEETRKLGTNKRQQLLEMQAAGLITQEEMRPKANSPFHNNDGSINVDSALAIGADRAGRGEGIKSEKTDYDAALGTYKMLSAKKANEDLTDHEQLIYSDAAETMADIIKRRRAKTVTGKPATDVVVQAAAPEKKKPKAGAAGLLGGL